MKQDLSTCGEVGVLGLGLEVPEEGGMEMGISCFNADTEGCIAEPVVNYCFSKHFECQVEGPLVLVGCLFQLMGEWETEKHPLELSATNFVLLLVKVTKKVKSKGKYQEQSE